MHRTKTYGKKSNDPIFTAKDVEFILFSMILLARGCRARGDANS